MGKVWKATLLDQGRSRPLRAIKTVRQDLRSHQTALQREIALLETLARPDYFPVVHESFLANDQLFMVMDWVEGRTLQSLINGSVLEIDRSRFLRIVEQIVDRLSYLHNWQPRPIVFRDLKPSNVMLDRDTDHLRLVDFGISHAVFPGRDRVGGYTPGWISPEAANGDVTPATDIYALGRVVLALLFGNVEPSKIRDSSLIPSGEGRGLPQRLVRVARRMMAERRADRPPTAVAALLALRDALETEKASSNDTTRRMSRCACGGLVPPRHTFCSRCGSWRARPSPSAQAAPAVPIEALVSPPAGTAIAPPWQQRALLDLLEVRAGADLGTLRCIPTIEVQPYGYQRQAATRVLSEMQGRALIADDVGLGKTIEAGLIIKEYLYRRMARRVLIVCPPGLLLSQMQEELRAKFRLQFREFRGSTTDSSASLIGPRELARTDLVIVSLATFRREQNLRRFLAQTWDLLVVDECHHIKNHTSTSHKAVRRLTTRYAVFMSATPFSGKMKELWSIYSALRPGWLGADYQSFRSRFLYGYGNEPTPELRQYIRELTIRRRRKDLLVKFPGRLAKRVEVDLPSRFAGLYRHLASLAVDRGRGFLDRTTLMQQICSSYESLKDNVFWKRITGGVPRELRDLTDDDHPKAKWLVDRVVPRVPRREKVLIFSRFRRSQSAIARLLRKAGHNAEALREHDGKRRHRLLHDFLENRDGVRLLVCGEGAGEGLNLQRASLLINYDLPWNPMKVEQRIGRVQRLGQQRVQVTVINVVMRGTVEEQVLEVMQEKLRVFNNLLGDTEQILGEVFNSDGAAERRSFEHWLASALLPDGRLDPGTLNQIGGAIDSARAAVARGAQESAPSLDNVFDGDDEDLHGIPSPTKPPVILADEDLF